MITGLFRRRRYLFMGLSFPAQQALLHSPADMDWLVMRDLYEELFTAAKRRGETQETIAARGGIRQNKISNLLSMKKSLGPQAETFIRAIEGLGITPAEFFTEISRRRTLTDKTPTALSGNTALGSEPDDAGGGGSLSAPAADLQAAVAHLLIEAGSRLLVGPRVDEPADSARPADHPVESSARRSKKRRAPNR